MDCPMDRKTRLSEYEKSLKQILFQLLTIQEQIKKERQNFNNSTSRNPQATQNPTRRELQSGPACRIPNRNRNPNQNFNQNPNAAGSCPMKFQCRNNGTGVSQKPANRRNMSPIRETDQMLMPNRSQDSSFAGSDQINDKFTESNCKVQVRIDPTGNEVRRSQSITVLPKTGRFQRMIAIKENPDGTLSKMYVIRKEYLPNNQDQNKKSNTSQEECPYKPGRNARKPPCCPNACPRKKPKDPCAFNNDDANEGIQLYPPRNLKYDSCGVASIGNTKTIPLKKSLSCDISKINEDETSEENIGHDPFVALQKLIAKYENPPDNKCALKKSSTSCPVEVKRKEKPKTTGGELQKTIKKPSEVEVESYKMINEIVNTTICIFATVNCCMKSDPIKAVETLPKDASEVKQLIVNSLKKSEEYRLIIQSGMQKMLKEMENRSKIFAPHLHCLYMNRVKQIKNITDESISELPSSFPSQELPKSSSMQSSPVVPKTSSVVQTEIKPDATSLISVNSSENKMKAGLQPPILSKSSLHQLVADPNNPDPKVKEEADKD